MRAFTHSVAVLALSFGVLVACSEDETCVSARDCAPGLRCERGACVQATGGIASDAGPAPDLGVVTSTNADGGAADAGLDAGPDGGPTDSGPTDASSLDAAPMGADAGTLGPYDSGVDGGLPTSTSLPSSGRVVLGVYQSNPTVETGFAEFIDRTGVTYSVLEWTVPDIEGGRCVVRSVRVASGAPRGIPARQVSFSAKTSGQMRIFSPVPGVPGRFEPSTQPTVGFFNRPGDIFMRIETTGVAGTLEDYRRAVGAPSFFQPVAPALGTTVNVLGGIDLRWNVNTIGGEQSTFVELYDARREVVLRCVTPNDGAYQVPIAAISAWYSERPSIPATLDVGYEIVPALDAVQLRGGGQIPLTASFQQGARYSAQ